jgi:hypothetical protein
MEPSIRRPEAPARLARTTTATFRIPESSNFINLAGAKNLPQAYAVHNGETTFQAELFA